MPRTRTNDTRTSEAPSGVCHVDGFNPNPNPINVPGHGIVGDPYTNSFTPSLAAGTAAATRLGSLSTITDLGGENLKGYNPVTHTRTTYAGDSIREISGSWEVWGNQPKPLLLTIRPGSRLGVGTLVDTSESLPIIRSRSLCEAIACNSMRPNQPEVVIDLPRFIGELTDLSILVKGTYKRLGKSIEHFLRETGDSRSLVYWLDRKLPYMGNSGQLKRRAARLPGQRAVGADLAWKFVVEPLLADFNKISQAIQGIDETYRRMLNPKPFVVRGRYTESVKSALRTNELTYNTWTRVTEQTRTVVCWAQVQHSALRVSQMEILRHRLGFMANASSLWELIPFSFILDMVIDVGAWLRQFDGGVISLPYTILKQGSSLKDDTVTTVTIWPLRGTEALHRNAGTRPITGTRSTVSYSRESKILPFNSAALTPIQTGLPNLGQIGSIAELIYSAFRRK